MNTSIKQASAVFIQRYATAAEWRANNPILYPGEIGIESDTGKIKVGGAIQSFWNDLDYAGGGADIVVYDSLEELPDEAEEDTIAVLPDVAIEMFNSEVIHVRYSAYQDGTNFTTEWSAGQNYIGIAVAKYAPVDKEAYEWSLFTSNIRLTTSIILRADGWADKVQTIVVPHISESSSVFSTPHPATREEYINHGIYLESATTENLTFSCVTLPNLDIQVNIQIVEPLMQPEVDDSDDLPFNIIEVPTLEELPNDDQILDGTMALIPTASSTEDADHTFSSQWRNMSVIDLTEYFDFAQSVLSGGSMVNVSCDICADLLEVMKNEPVKLKVKFDTYTAIVTTLAQNFDTYCQFVDFVILNGKLLYLYLSVNTSNFSFQCQEVVTKPYGT